MLIPARGKHQARQYRCWLLRVELSLCALSDEDGRVWVGLNKFTPALSTKCLKHAIARNTQTDERTLEEAA